MRYSANADKSCFIAYKLEDNKRVKVAKIEIRLFDARMQYFGKGKFAETGCYVSPMENATYEDFSAVHKDIPKLKRNRLDYVLEQLDRYLLEAYMMVTGRTTQKEYSCEPIRIDDYRSEDLVRYGYALKHRAAVLGNDLIRKGEKAKKPGTKILKVCHSFLKDGYDEYSNDSLAYYRRRIR